MSSPQLQLPVVVVCEWTYYRDVPEREGLMRYTHLIRSPLDPPATMGHGHKVRDPLHWKKTHSAEVYRKKILELMKDGEPRTFNAICVELTGTTADVWFEKEPDEALWSLVKDRALAWAQENGAIFFIDAGFVNWSS